MHLSEARSQNERSDEKQSGRLYPEPNNKERGKKRKKKEGGGGGMIVLWVIFVIHDVQLRPVNIPCQDRLSVPTI